MAAGEVLSAALHPDAESKKSLMKSFSSRESSADLAGPTRAAQGIQRSELVP